MLMDGSVVLKINICFKKCYVSLFEPHCTPLPPKRTIDPKQADVVACNKIVADQPVHFSSQVSIFRVRKIIFPILKLKHLLCVLKRSVSLRRFF